MSAAAEVLVIRTGVANVASVVAGLRRAGAEPEITVDPVRIASAPRVVLPGVGAFGAATASLADLGLTDVVADRIRAGRPLLAVCLGMQLFAAESDETPGARGLGVVDGRVTRFPDTVRVPQLGWNRVAPDAACRLLEPGYAYFANSFRLTEAPAGYACAWSDHGGPFVAALERGPVLACQFHPELSGPWGLDLLRRWLAAGADATPDDKGGA